MHVAFWCLFICAQFLGESLALDEWRWWKKVAGSIEPGPAGSAPGAAGPASSQLFLPSEGGKRRYRDAVWEGEELDLLFGAGEARGAWALPPSHSAFDAIATF